MSPAPIIIKSPRYFARLHQRLGRRLPMWVVYRPMNAEYPGLWVARMHITLPAPKVSRFVISHNTLKALRELLPPGCFRIPRDPADAPEIEEVWL